VSEHGGIRKADLNRKSNQLPSISYVRNRWGGIIPMKEALGIQSGLQKWNRKRVEDTLKQWIEEGGDLLQSDLLQKNRLPSLPCILRYFPELKSFNEIKEHFGLQRTHEEWTKDKAINAGKKFISNHGPHLRQYHLNKTNGLPTARTIDRLFGSLRNYQETIGSSIHDRNKKKTVDDVKAAIDELFGHKERVVRNKTDFYKRFRISDAAISRLFGSTDRLFSEHSIKELEPKRASFSKDEIDQEIMEFVKKKGERIPKPRELKKYGLPSKDTIEKYYQSYRQPFIYFYRMISKSN
jgi:hypothetical protein